MKPTLLRLVLCCVLAAPLAGNAQFAPAAPGSMEAASRPVPPGALDRFVKPFAALKFDSEMKTLGVGSSLGNSVLRPAGSGPFPAVVVTHSCGGVDQPQLRERAAELLAAGYAVLMLDSFKPRGQVECRAGVITVPLVVRDALDALAHLQTLAQVDQQRIYLVGFSMGSLSAQSVASPSIRAYFSAPHPFRAAVGWYGSCGVQSAPNAPNANFLRADTDTPLLLLMAEGDRETPIRPFCFPVIEQLKAAGRPIEWHIYADGVTHAWDARAGYTITNGWGEKVVNQYNASATEDAMRRTLEFLKRHR